jgi:hypothetical protein
VEALGPVNAAADRADGFVWRLQTDEGNATSAKAITWDTGDSAGVIVNMSVWSDVEHLTAFVLGDLHRAVLRRRREFFAKMGNAYLARWWVPEGHQPSTEEAEEQVLYLRANGPTPFAARALPGAGVPPRDVGRVLGGSYERAHQLPR